MICKLRPVAGMGDRVERHLHPREEQHRRDLKAGRRNSDCTCFWQCRAPVLTLRVLQGFMSEAPMTGPLRNTRHEAFVPSFCSKAKSPSTRSLEAGFVRDEWQFREAV